MNVKWSKSAQSHWFEAASYIKTEFGIMALDNFAKATDDVVRQLSFMPSCGPFEPLLSHRNGNYRSIVYGKYSKLIYVVCNDIITIVDYWDTRREPKQLAERI